MKSAPLPEKKEHLRIPLPYFIALLTILIGLIIWYFLMAGDTKGQQDKSAKMDTSIQDNVQVIRNKDFSLIKPLILVDKSVESEELRTIKEELELLINTKKGSQQISSGSIYLRKLTKGDWICINGNEPFPTGSLMKVPVMIYYLKKAETNPQLLNQKILFNNPDIQIPVQSFTSKSITIGKQYSIKELLEYMIKYSDNNATYLLNRNMDKGVFLKVFTDLGMAKPDMMSLQNKLTTIEFSRFFRVLYNGSYLSPAMSQLAMELLSESEFMPGIKRDLPNEIVVAHKFGEASFGEVRTFSESGIIYDSDDPYLITIMAQGNNDNQLISFIAEVSATIYTKIRQRI